MKSPQLLLLVPILILAGCDQPPSGELRLAEGMLQHVVRSDEIVWRQCPPTLPEGCEMAVLEGDPQSAGLFTIRFRVSGTFVMPPHTHPKEERVTILSGRVSVGFGMDATHETAATFEAGDYYVNARDEIHTVWAVEETELQINGIGPWEAHFVE